jgi:hypothetical protein
MHPSSLTDGIREVDSVPLVVMANSSLGRGASRSRIVSPRSDTSIPLFWFDERNVQCIDDGFVEANALALEIRATNVMKRGVDIDENILLDWERLSGLKITKQVRSMIWTWAR